MDTLVSAKDYDHQFAGYTIESGQIRFGRGHAYSGEDGNLIIQPTAKGFREAQVGFKAHNPPQAATGRPGSYTPQEAEKKYAETGGKEPYDSRFVRRYLP